MILHCPACHHEAQAASAEGQICDWCGGKMEFFGRDYIERHFVEGIVREALLVRYKTFRSGTGHTVYRPVTITSGPRFKAIEALGAMVAEAWAALEEVTGTSDPAEAARIARRASARLYEMGQEAVKKPVAEEEDGGAA